LGLKEMDTGTCCDRKEGVLSAVKIDLVGDVISYIYMPCSETRRNLPKEGFQPSVIYTEFDTPAITE
jgi:hypothetical protein